MEAVSICENLYEAGFNHLPSIVIQYLKSKDEQQVGDDIIKVAAKVIARKELETNKDVDEG